MRTINSTMTSEDIFEMEMQELEESLVKEAINFFSEPKNNRSQDCERFFFKRTEWEQVINNCNPNYIDPYIIYDETGDIWGFAIRPNFQKKVRIKTKEESNPEDIAYVERVWSNSCKQFKENMVKICKYYKFTKSSWKAFYNWYVKFYMFPTSERKVSFKVAVQIKHNEGKNYYTIPACDSKTNQNETYYFDLMS